jgi:hypothetical protein
MHNNYMKQIHRTAQNNPCIHGSMLTLHIQEQEKLSDT